MTKPSQRLWGFYSGSGREGSSLLEFQKWFNPKDTFYKFSGSHPQSHPYLNLKNAWRQQTTAAGSLRTEMSAFIVCHGMVLTKILLYLLCFDGIKSIFGGIIYCVLTVTGRFFACLPAGLGSHSPREILHLMH